MLLGGPGRRREPIGHAGQVLHDAVVEVARDLAALDLGRVQRALQERLPLALAQLEPAGQRVGERDLHELEHHEGAERDGSEAAPQPGAARAHRVVREVGLEQQGFSRRRVHRQVDLEQLPALRPLVAVLRLVEIAHLGFDPAGVDRLDLVRAEVERAPDEAGLVRVDDPAVLGPQLEPDQVLVEHVRRHHRVEPGHRVGVTVEQRLVDRRLDEALGLGDGGRAGVGHRLPLTDPSAGDGGRQADDRQRDQPGQRELPDLDEEQPSTGSRSATHPRLGAPPSPASVPTACGAGGRATSGRRRTRCPDGPGRRRCFRRCRPRARRRSRTASRCRAPRVFVGFHERAVPATGSIAPMPGRETAPGPAELWPSGLSSQRWCPPTYTATPVTATLYRLSPPVQLIQVGSAVGADVGRLEPGGRVAEPDRSRSSPPVVTITK